MTRGADGLIWPGLPSSPAVTGTDNSKAIDERVAEFDQALVNLERAQASGDGKALARAVQQARIILYVVSKRLEHLQPSADQWAMIDDRLERLARWLAKYD